MHPLAAILPVFLITRATIFFAATAATDTQMYHTYGAAARAESVAALYRQHDAEYPQLTVAFSAFVGWVADQLPAGAERLIGARESTLPYEYIGRYQVAFGLVLFVLDAGLLLLVQHLARRLNPGDRITQTWRLGLYTAATAALGPLIYDRLDLVIGAVALVSLALVNSGRSVLVYAVLTAGVGFKLVPLLLFPVMVASFATSRGGRFWPAVGREAAIAGGILATWPVLAHLFGGGDRAFVYLKYHSQRGLDVSSVYGAPVLIWEHADIGLTYGGFTVDNPTADTVANLSPVVTLAALSVAALLAIRAIRRSDAANRLTITASGCVLVWLAFIISNKVGSPQYLLWIAPLVPLLSLRTTGERRITVGFVIAAVLTTMMYPYLWPQVHGPELPYRPGAWSGPTMLGFVLLGSRWISLTLPTIGLAVWLWRVVGGPPQRAAPTEHLGL